MPRIVENYLPIVSTTQGPAVLIPTVQGVRYSGNVTLAEALAAIQTQVTESAALVAEDTARVADMRTFLTERFGYVPTEHNTGNTYLTPMFQELPKVPTETSIES